MAGLHLFRLLLPLLACLPHLQALGQQNQPIVTEERARVRVLIVNSYHSTYTWTADQCEAFMRKVLEEYPNAEFFCAFLDAKRTLPWDDYAYVEEHLRDKYGNLKFDLVYASDDVALELCHKLSGTLWDSETPIVASGINDQSLLDRDTHPNTHGVYELLNAGEIVPTAKRLHPRANKLVIVADSTQVGKDTADSVQAQLEKVTTLPIERNRPGTWKDTLEYINSLGEDAIVLLATYMVDEDGHYIEPVQASLDLQLHSLSPVYAFSEVYFASPGMVGGLVNRAADQGRGAGELALQILGKVPAETIPSLKTMPQRWIFNHQSMKAFGISERELPPGSILQYRPDSLLRSHPVEAAAVTLGILVQSALIGILMLNIRRRQAVTLEVRNKEAQMRLLIEHSPLAISVSDQSGRIVITNRRFTQITGYGLGEVPTLDDAKRLLFPDPDYRSSIGEKLDQRIQQAREGDKRPPPLEYRAWRKDGRELYLEMHFAHTVGLDFRIFNDISQRRKAMQDLIAATEVAQAASQAKSRFLANVSHEIRTPMNGIMGMVQLLRDTSIREDQTDYIDTIQDSCELLVTVINDILDLSSIEAGQMKLEAKEVDLKNFLRGLASLAAPTVESRGLEFVCDIDERLPGVICIDPSRLKQVLLNLLVNASKFTERGSVTMRVMALERSKKQAQIRFEVADTGIGIAPDMQEKVFEPFVQVESAQKQRKGGTGLGLSISRRLVQLMGGIMDLQSQEGHGSTFGFSISVPVIDIAVPAGRQTAQLNHRIGESHPLRILVAEDNGVNQKVALMILRKMGYAPDLAANGEEALSLCAKNRYDLILMDVQMPVMDGLVATRKIRASKGGTHPRIVALTAHALAEDVRNCTEAGMDAHLPKPLNVPLLECTLMETHAALLARQR